VCVRVCEGVVYVWVLCCVCDVPLPLCRGLNTKPSRHSGAPVTFSPDQYEAWREIVDWSDFRHPAYHIDAISTVSRLAHEETQQFTERAAYSTGRR
jgi:hypothetical protein